MSADLSFLRAVVLKTSFHPEPLRRCQAAILYRALEGGEFTADEVLAGEFTNGDTKLPGLTIGSLACLGLIICVGRRKASSESRNGAKTNVWAINGVKRSTALTWLARNQFPKPSDRQLELIA